MSKPNQYNGALIIDKPEGLTSHDVVARLRRILRTKKIGHTGTLDPFATGVLVMLVGKATRLARYLDKDVKSYEARLRFGFETDTGDKEGDRRQETGDRSQESEVESDRSIGLRSEPAAVAGGLEEEVRTQEPTIDEIDDEEQGEVVDLPPREELIERVESVLPDFKGKIQQIPPMYSAKKLKGKKLYELARQGIEVAREPIDINIYDLEIIDAEGEENEISLRVSCSAGTYIRTLAQDIGRRIRIGCHLSALRRIRAGGFRLRDAITLEQLETIVDEGRAGETLIPMNKVVTHLPSQTLDEADVKQIAHGMKIDARITTDTVQNIRLTDRADELVAIGEIDPNGMIQPKVVFNSE